MRIIFNIIVPNKEYDVETDLDVDIPTRSNGEDGIRIESNAPGKESNNDQIRMGRRTIAERTFPFCRRQIGPICAVML